MNKIKIVNEFLKENVFKKYFSEWIFVIILQILYYITISFIPYYYKVIIDALVNKNWVQTNRGIFIFILIQIFSLISLLLQRIWRYKLDLKIWKDINYFMHRKYHRMSYAETFQYPPGEIMQRFVDDTWNVIPLAGYVPAEFIGYIAFFISIMVIGGILSPFLSVILLAYFIIYISGYKFYYSRKIPSITQNRQNAYSNYTRVLEESLNMSYDIRLHRGLKGVEGKFELIVKDFIKKHFDFLKVNIVYQGIFVNGLLSLSTLLILIIGVILLFKNLVSVGILIAFVYYNKYLYDLISFLTSLTSIVEPSIVSLNRVNEILNKKEKYIVETSKKIEIPKDYPYAVEIKNLDFELNGIKIFNKLNLAIEKNKITVIFGESGSGKTTLLNLLFKLYEIPDNKIFIFGKDINQYSLEELFGTLVCVVQEPKFFTGSVEENLRIFYEDLHEEKLKDILQQLNVEKVYEYFIEKPSGTKLMDLSGGERKILEIVRGLLHDAPIKILDEPTAFVDKVRAENILNFLKNNSKNSTIIIFSHDPLTRKYADEVIQFKKV